jgi:hypothetical protein
MIRNHYEKPLPVWINRFGIRTPIKYLSNKHILNNLRFLKRKGLKKCEENNDKLEYWGNHVPEIYYELVKECQIRNLDYESILDSVQTGDFENQPIL